jgi:hypothetical protein
MKRSHVLPMMSHRLLLLFVSTIVTLGMMFAGTALADCVQTSKVHDTAAQKAYIDSETGEIVKKPKKNQPGAGEQITPAEQIKQLEEKGTSHEGLESEPANIPGLDRKIDLKGRFQKPVKAIVGKDGKISVYHK